VTSVWQALVARIMVTLCGVVALCLVPQSLRAAPADAAPADAASAKYSIAVFISQPANRCYDTGVVKAIEHFVKRRIAALNARPELVERRLRVDIYNDYSDPVAAVANVRKALDNPATLAMIGLSGSNRAKAVFEKLGPDIAKRNVPFITDMSVTELFEPFPSVFTMRPSQESERIPVVARFLKDGAYQRPAFVGMAENAAADELAKLLRENAQSVPLVAEQYIPVKEGVPSEMDLKAAVAAVKDKDADIVLVLLGSASAERFLTEAQAAGVRSEIFLLTDNDRVLRTPAAKAHGTNLYQLAWTSLPEVYSSRMRREMLSDPGERWLFQDRADKSAEGWQTGACKPPADGIATNPLDSVNLRALSRGTRFGDMVGLIGEIMKTSPPDLSLDALKARIVEQIKVSYAAGRGTYAGNFNNWSFHPLARTVSQTPLILKKFRTSATPRLAPRQYVKLRNDALREIKTIYMDVDLTRLYRVDDNEKSFFAEFFLTMDAESSVPVAAIEFANAFFDAESGGKTITIVPLNEGIDTGVYPNGLRLYKITGKFMMQPDFSRYPFDTQLFPIELKPKNGDVAFIVQPPPAALRDRVFQTDGWSLRDQFVGYDEDYVPVTDARTDEKSIIPFYKAEFSYVMQREATDYYLRVVVPLAFILIVAFLSVFIPNDHFEAIVTIQVTALLAAVALYLSIPKVGNDAATVSDTLFLVDYLAVSAMIAISIARVSPLVRNRPLFDQTLKYVHIIGTPVLIAFMAYYLAEMQWQGPRAFYGDENVAQIEAVNPAPAPAKQ
jgi:hypothetical protein